MRLKKICAMMLSSAMILSMAGCAKSDVSSSSSEAIESVATTEATEATSNTEEETTKPEVNDVFNDMTGMEFIKGMKIGWNLGNVLESTKSKDTPVDAKPMIFETAWGAQYTSREQIEYVLDAGFNVIRIPVTWTGHIYDDEKHTIEVTWMDRIQEVVDYAYNHGAYVILNSHHEDWNHPTDDNVDAGSQMIKDVWTQIGERFAGYGERLIFEGMNEPRLVGEKEEWTGTDSARQIVNTFSQVFVDTIRGLGGNNAKRFLMIPGYAASSWDVNLKAIKVPDDDHVIVSVHAYIPYNFALAGGGTTNWSSEKAGDTREIDTLMKNIDEIFLSKNIPVIIGEFGAQSKENDPARCDWVSYYVNAAKSIGVPCVWWDNHCYRGDGEKFGLLLCNGFNFSWKYPDVLEAMIKASEK